MSRPEEILYVPLDCVFSLGLGPYILTITLVIGGGLSLTFSASGSPPDLYYNDATTAKYATSSRLHSIQTQMTYRALSLLRLPSPSLVLDIGCGTGLSGSILSSDPSHPPAHSPRHLHSEHQSGMAGGPHTWIGLDISSSMLSAAMLRPDIPTGTLLLGDMGQGLSMFRAGTFDAAISISAIQWLCAEENGVGAETRLRRFFEGLYASLRRGGKAVCQFYPGGSGKGGEEKRRMIERAAVRAGFGAGVLEDDPGTKAGKLYLVLTVGGGALDLASSADVDLAGSNTNTNTTNGDITGMVRGMEGVDVVDGRRRRKAKRTSRGAGREEPDGGGGGGGGGLSSSSSNARKGSKAWIMKKKERMERQGKVVKASSKYTGRKRRVAF
ncbi:MAG: hypothetical protein M1837_003776 [Sclerophora amabilis]|nr:MAG: hypothetical protein M1837_003776 [Sclerophora amabilis]